MQHIEAKALAQLLTDAPDTKVVDVREADELVYGVIEGALHIPMNTIPAQLAQLGEQTDPVVVVCHAGVRSQHVAQFLEQAGFSQVINLIGGMNSWATDVDSSVSVY